MLVSFITNIKNVFLIWNISPLTDCASQTKKIEAKSINLS